MNYLSIIIIAIGLASDSFAVAICNGTIIRNRILFYSILISVVFSFSQVLMPFLGYLLGNAFSKYLINVDHWIAFILLLLIGGNMLFDNSSNQNELHYVLSIGNLFFLSMATSIDAFAVGVTFSFFHLSFLIVLLIIGIVTFIMSFFGAYIGYIFGKKYEKTSKILGGLILIFMAFRLLFQHLFL